MKKKNTENTELELVVGTECWWKSSWNRSYWFHRFPFSSPTARTTASPGKRLAWCWELDADGSTPAGWLLGGYHPLWMMVRFYEWNDLYRLPAGEGYLCGVPVALLADRVSVARAACESWPASLPSCSGDVRCVTKVGRGPPGALRLWLLGPPIASSSRSRLLVALVLERASKMSPATKLASQQDWTDSGVAVDVVVAAVSWSRCIFWLCSPLWNNLATETRASCGS